MKSTTLALVMVVFVFAVQTPLAFSRPDPATVSRVLPRGHRPHDPRIEKPKTLNDYFPLEVPATREAWEKRAQKIRRQTLVATGLWPMPRKTPLNAVIHGRVERDDFTVDKVYFESYPGHFVTGLLFRPKGRSGRLPGVLSPHGHGGRLQDHGERIRQLIVQGEERFEGSGRFPKLSRCVQLARMGCVTFIYDMLGYADSVQIPDRIGHGGRADDPDADTAESWRFFSTQAELRLQSTFGLQTYNSIRALDFLASLPDVDPERLGVTGGSGGGTQTIILCGIDPRPIVSFPQGMVSTAMQGGCSCENASLLRVGTGNVEFAALFAPKPQAMTAADDWTVDMMTKGYPQLRRLYSLLGKRDNVLCKSLVQFKHNYNYVTRAIMYSWFNKHLDLDLEDPVVEEDYPPLTPQEWTVWNDEHPQPQGGDEHERSLTKWMDEESRRQMQELRPTDSASLKRYREVVGGAFEAIIGRGLPEGGDVEREGVHKDDRGDYLMFRDLLRIKSHGEELPMLSLYPKSWNRQVAIWIDGQGKAALLNAEGAPRAEIQKLLSAGVAVLGADLLWQGEFLEDGVPLTETFMAVHRRKISPAYVQGYNATLFARRVHDILSLVTFVRYDSHEPDGIHLVGVGGAGPWVAAARTLCGDLVKRTALDTAGFRFVNLRSYRDINHLTGAVKYGDLPALLALSAPAELWVAGENGTIPDLAAMAYRAAGAENALESSAVAQGDVASAAVEWLLRK